MATKAQDQTMTKGQYVIVRTYSAGCFAGTLVSRKGQDVTLKDARREQQPTCRCRGDRIRGAVAHCPGRAGVDMSWDEHHSRSERLASQGEHVARAGDRAAAEKLYAQAAEAEVAALDGLAPEKLRTRGITSVSAVALWYKAHELSRAEQLAYRSLAGGDLPEFAQAQIRELLTLIWTTRSAEAVLAYPLPAAPPMTSAREAEDTTWAGAVTYVRDMAATIRAMAQKFVSDPGMAELAKVRAEALDSCADGMERAAKKARAAAPPVTDTPQGKEADDDPAAWFPSPDLRCITCGHLMSVHLATRGRCLSLNAVEGGSVPCACTAFVVDMMDALRAAAPAAPPQEDQ